MTFEDRAGAPVAGHDYFYAIVSEPLMLPLSTLLANDTDPDGDELMVTDISDPAHGAVAIHRGMMAYDPGMDFEGLDQFHYTVSDGEHTATGTVSVLVVDPDVLEGEPGEDRAADAAGFGAAGHPGADADAGAPGRTDGAARAGRFASDEAEGLLGGRWEMPLVGNSGLGLLRASGGWHGFSDDAFQFPSDDSQNSLFGFQISRLMTRAFIAGDEIKQSGHHVESFADLATYAGGEAEGALFAREDDLFLRGTQLAALDADQFSFY